ncbi:kelch repeat-containing protein [Sorangium sp. So ce394]|uniref:Kelch repeat-containing protein n=1 Tax=Sorangium sp. So ce394 TaxID=3133310 RepID=UPI003F5C5DEA
MSPRGSLRRVLPRLPLLLWAAACLSGCSGEVEPPASAAALRRQFPDQSAAVLEAREAFVGDGEGFHLGSAEVSGTPARPHVVLPREGSDPIRMRTPAGVEVRVRELGAAGEGMAVEQAVAYRRSGGTSFWSATERGVEEWLLLDEGVARGGEAVAAWEVEGATLRERGEAVELVEEGRGTAVLRVSAPRAHALSGRPVAVALKARGSRIELTVDAGGEAVLVDPAWVLTHGALNVARKGHTATLLRSGFVLVAGGFEDDLLDGTVVTFDSAELYDPAADAWSFTGSMKHGRTGHTATLLSSGEVLVAGGVLRNPQDVDRMLETAELYHPETGRWTDAAPMHLDRVNHTATLLPSGKVLVAGGGQNAFFMDSVELYDPASNRWELMAPMDDPRAGHEATLLSNGKVLVAGGSYVPGAYATAQLYDPETDRWEFTKEPMNYARSGLTMTPLLNGEVLVAGGRHRDGTWIASAERYDPGTGRWRLTSPMNRGRVSYTASLLPDGMVLFAGGLTDNLFYLSSAERYDPAANTWTVTTPMSSPRVGHTATRLSSGQVLVAGGNYSDITLAETERFGLARGEACTSATACLSPDICVDGTCCDVPCPCGTCGAPGTEGRCGETGSPEKAGSICAPARCADELNTFEAVRCTTASSSCPAQVSVPCVAYRCDPQSGACRQSCVSMDDCLSGYVCNLRGHCVPAPPAPEAASGCSAGPGRAAPVAACAAGALLLALGVARRRRRRPGRSAAATARARMTPSQPGG